MNKLKFFIYFLLVAIFSYCPFSSFSSSNINSYLCNAISISTYNVNFYGSDNETLIYSVDVPYGKSLQDLENSNLVNNSFFSGIVSQSYNLSSNYNNFNLNNGWFLQANTSGGVVSVTQNNSFGISLVRSLNTGYTYLQYPVNISENNKYFLYLSSNGKILKASINVDTFPTAYSAVFISSSSADFPFFTRLEYIVSGGVVSKVYLNIGTNATVFSNFNVDFVYFGLYDVEYFDLDYVNQLYVNSGGDFNNGAIWTSTYNTYQPYDFNEIVTNDLNLWVDRPNVTFYASDNITPVLTYDNWSLGSSLYGFSSVDPYYNYTYLIQTLLTTTKYSYQDYQDGYIDVIFNDNQLFENTSFSSSYVISNDVNIYFKVNELYFSDKIYSNYTLSTSNSDIFSSTGQNLLNNISLSGVSYSYNYFNQYSNGLVSIFYSPELLDTFNLGSNFSIYVDSYNNEFYFYTNVLFFNSKYQYYNYLYKVNINNYKHIVVPVCDYNIFVIKVGDDYVFYGDYQNVTYQINKSYYAFDFTFNYNMQNFFADYFGFRFKISNFSTSNNNKCNIFLNDVNNYFYIKSFNNNTLVNYNLLSSSYLKSYYVKDVYIYFEGESLLRVQGLNYTSISRDDVINALNSKTINFEVLDPIIYFYQSTSDSYGSIVPTTSSALYKSDVGMFDFAGHIYNAFIYIIFDAPIVSNITRIIYQIVSLIIWIFNQIIALFVGTKNNIFLVAIVGFMVLKFTISLFWKKE